MSWTETNIRMKKELWKMKKEEYPRYSDISAESAFPLASRKEKVQRKKMTISNKEQLNAECRKESTDFPDWKKGGRIGEEEKGRERENTKESKNMKNEGKKE